MTLSKTLYLVGIIGFLVGSAAPLTYALPSNEVETFFYTDENYENLAGYTLLACNGSKVSTGKTAKYRLRYQTPCDAGGPIYASCYIDGRPTGCPEDICDVPWFVCE